MMKNRYIALVIGITMLIGVATAQSFQSGGVYYRLTGNNTVCVDAVPESERVAHPYKGVFIIPEQVYYDGASHTVTAVADSAFFQSLATEIQLPNTVKTIGEAAFAYATHLTDITLPLHLSKVSKMMLAGSGVVNVVFPEGISTVGWGAFQSCGDLHTALLPSSLKTIEAYGFNACHNLAEIYCAAPTPPNASGWAIFIGLSGIDVIVPDDAAADLYAANSVWGDATTFSLYPSEDITVSLSNQAELYSEQWARLSLGNNLAYKIYQGEELIALTAANYYYVPITNQAVTYTIVPTDLMHDADEVPVVVGATAVRDLEETNGTQPVMVYDLTGRCVYRGTSEGDVLNLLEHGRVYIIKAGNTAKKIRLQ